MLRVPSSGRFLLHKALAYLGQLETIIFQKKTGNLTAATDCWSFIITLFLQKRFNISRCLTIVLALLALCFLTN